MRSAVFCCVLGVSLGLLVYVGERLIFFDSYPRFLLIFAGASLFITAGAALTGNVPTPTPEDNAQKEKEHE